MRFRSANASGHWCVPDCPSDGCMCLGGTVPDTIPSAALHAIVWLGGVLSGYLSASLTPRRVAHLRLSWRYPPLFFALLAAWAMAWAMHELGWLRLLKRLLWGCGLLGCSNWRLDSLQESPRGPGN